ncbi:MAG: ATP-dependent DNA helicase, partial [Deltaproteobacteria bacterium]|nr:ATP-dependent DNA helicase [Deltaproteobacteria bacterium]
HIETIVQVPGMKESERDRFLTRFSEDNHGTLVGFAVMGGIFGEGIDLAGERLCGAVIVGVGLPAFTPERELIRQYHTENQQPGYEFAYVYPGLNRVLQAAGRVVRSENDRGVILLIDQRYSYRHYASLLPKEWRPIRVRDTAQTNAALAAFWTS